MQITWLQRELDHTHQRSIFLEISRSSLGIEDLSEVCRFVDLVTLNV